MFAICLFSVNLFGQNRLLKPASTLFNLTQENVTTYTCPTFDVSQMLAEDAEDEELGGKPYRFAKKFITNISPTTDGNWETVDGYNIWRYKITSPDAFAMMVVLTEFHLTSTSTLFVYNKDKSYVAGPYTEKYNNETKVQPIRLIPGEEIILELIYHETDTEIPYFDISSVSHDYRNILPFLGLDGKTIGDLLECHIDVNCTISKQWNPLVQDWQVEKQSVARIITPENLGTGALVNTINNSGIPYFLTARHVFPNQADVNASVFYFNHESLTCNKGDEGEENHIVEGAVTRATHPDTDFQLLELNARVPSSYRPFYAGWERDRNPLLCTVIHHPAGYRKKISFTDGGTTPYLTPLPEQVNPTDAIPPNHGWVVNLRYGTVQGGSSGAPVFDENQRIIGQLFGYYQIRNDKCQSSENHYVTCLAPSFGISWNIGNNQTERLSDWLAPTGSHPPRMTGYAPQGWLHEWVDEPSNSNNRKVKEGINTIDVGLGNQIFYRATDGLGNDDVRNFWFSLTTNTWQHGILGTEKITGDLVVGEGNQVFFKGSNDHLYTYWWSNGSWHPGQLSSA